MEITIKDITPIMEHLQGLKVGIDKEIAAARLLVADHDISGLERQIVETKLLANIGDKASKKLLPDLRKKKREVEDGLVEARLCTSCSPHAWG